jgi:hypothetical protein
MPLAPIHINLLERKLPDLRQQIRQLQGKNCSPLRLETKYTASGDPKICYLRERGLLEACYEDVGEFLGFQTRTEAVTRAQIAVERQLRHKLINMSDAVKTNAEGGMAADGEALRLLLHARIVGKSEKKALEEHPLQQDGPLLTWWEDQRCPGTVLDGLSVSKRAAETIIADLAVVPKEEANKAPGNPNWLNMHAMTCAAPTYQTECASKEEAQLRRATYAQFYEDQFDLLNGTARTLVVSPLKNYSRPHIEGLLDAIEWKRQQRGIREREVNITLATDDPYLYPLIRECLFARREKLDVAIPLPVEDFEVKRGAGVRISHVRMDQLDEVLLLLSRLVEASSAPLRIATEPGSQDAAIYLHERTVEEFFREYGMSAEQMAVHTSAACNAIDKLFQPVVDQIRNLACEGEERLSSASSGSRYRQQGVIDGGLEEQAEDQHHRISGDDGDSFLQSEAETPSDQAITLQLLIDSLKQRVITGERMTTMQIAAHIQSLKNRELERKRRTGGNTSPGTAAILQ